MIPFHRSPVSHGWLRITALLVTLLFLQSPALGGAIYKWKDASGEIHYTQTPPPGGISAEIIQGTAAPAGSQKAIHADQKKLQQQLDAFDERRTGQQQDQAREKERKEISEINEKNCIASKNNLARLQQGGNRRFLTPDGEVVRYTEEERQQRITDTRAQIEEYCTP